MNALLWAVFLIFTFVVLNNSIKKSKDKKEDKGQDHNSKMATIIRSRKKMLFLDENRSKEAIGMLNEIAKEDEKNKENKNK